MSDKIIVEASDRVRSTASSVHHKTTEEIEAGRKEAKKGAPKKPAKK